MTPERMAALVAWWVRRYTRTLPPSIARRRIDEIDADLHDHIEHERAQGTADRRIAWGIVGRMARGIPADAAWRAHTLDRVAPADRAQPGRRRWARVALVTALVLLVPLVAMQFTGEVAWSLADFVLAGVLLAGAGVLLERAARATRTVAHRVAVAALGLAAAVAGEADDAPGLVLFGLVVGAAAIAPMLLRALRRD